MATSPIGDKKDPPPNRVIKKTTAIETPKTALNLFFIYAPPFKKLYNLKFSAL
jgi:hypothetical protein